MQRAMVVRVRIPGVDAIRSFGRPAVACALFRSDWRPAQCDLVRFDWRITQIQRQFSFRLQDDNSIGANGGLAGRADERGNQDGGDRECSTHSARFSLVN